MHLKILMVFIINNFWLDLNKIDKKNSNIFNNQIYTGKFDENLNNPTRQILSLSDLLNGKFIIKFDRRQAKTREEFIKAKKIGWNKFHRKWRFE